MAEAVLTRGDRIRHLRLALAAPLGGFVSQAKFGALVAAEERRPKPYDMSTANRWEDNSELGLGAIEAMARIAQHYGIAYATRAWIAFGDEGVREAKGAPAGPAIEPRLVDTLVETRSEQREADAAGRAAPRAPASKFTKKSSADIAAAKKRGKRAG